MNPLKWLVRSLNDFRENFVDLHLFAQLLSRSSDATLNDPMHATQQSERSPILLLIDCAWNHGSTFRHLEQQKVLDLFLSYAREDGSGVALMNINVSTRGKPLNCADYITCLQENGDKSSPKFAMLNIALSKVKSAIARIVRYQNGIANELACVFSASPGFVRDLQTLIVDHVIVKR
jgi:hypothetical protein